MFYDFKFHIEEEFGRIIHRLPLQNILLKSLCTVSGANIRLEELYYLLASKGINEASIFHIILKLLGRPGHI